MKNPNRCAIHLTGHASSDLKKLSRHQDSIVDKLLVLEENPQAGKPLGGVLQGLRVLRFNLPGGSYRAVYEIQDDNICLIIIIGPRENLYQEAERRARVLRKQGVIS